MKATPAEVYKQIDNSLYNEQGDIWWDENRILHLLKSSVNPAALGTSAGFSTEYSNSIIAAHPPWM